MHNILPIAFYEQLVEINWFQRFFRVASRTDARTILSSVSAWECHGLCGVNQ